MAILHILDFERNFIHICKSRNFKRSLFDLDLKRKSNRVLLINTKRNLLKGVYDFFGSNGEMNAGKESAVYISFEIFFVKRDFYAQILSRTCKSQKKKKSSDTNFYSIKYKKIS